MVRQLHTHDRDFTHRLKAHLAHKSESDPVINDAVGKIIDEVKKRGDDAVLEYTNRFDGTQFKAEDMKVPADAIRAAWQSLEKNMQDTLQLAAARIRSYHEKQLPKDHRYTDDSGTTLGWKWTPIDTVGLYVPGSKAAYPSSVLMNAIPAGVAGVKRMAMVVPAPDDRLHPLVLAAAHVAGIEEIYKIGGAQAVAALAYGTATIPKVDKIVGPGNAYVAAAKRQLYGQVGIDMIAGPSEILVISDGSTDPDWLAADLLSQAEHDSDARSVFITNDAAHANAVTEAVERTLNTLSRQAIARKSWETRGLVVITDTLEQAAEVADNIAPEHLELCVRRPESLEPLIRHAGAIFLGPYTPEAVGDYIAGPSHVLPTSGSAAFSSGLDVYAFLKRISLIGASPESLRVYGANTAAFAHQEGLQAHALSVELRLKTLEKE